MALEIDRIPAEFAVMMVPIVGSIALFSFLAVASWSDARRREREAYYTAETLKKIVDSPGEGAKAAAELMQQKSRDVTMRRIEGIKIGGLVTAATGIGVMALLHGLVSEEPVYLAGLIPLLVGVALLIYVFALAPKEIAARP